MVSGGSSRIRCLCSGYSPDDVTGLTVAVVAGVDSADVLAAGDEAASLDVGSVVVVSVVSA